MASAKSIEADPVPHRMRQEVGSDPPGLKLGQHIFIAAPVFKPLIVAMKARPDTRMPFMNRDLPASPGKHDRCAKACRARAYHGHLRAHREPPCVRMQRVITGRISLMRPASPL